MHFLATAITGLAAIGYLATSVNASPALRPDNEVATGGCTFCAKEHGCYVERKCYYPERPQFDRCCPYNKGMVWMPNRGETAQVVMENQGDFTDHQKPVEARAASPQAPATATNGPDSQETMPPRMGYCCQGGCHWCSEGHRCPIDDGCFYPTKPQYNYCCPYNGNMVWIPGDFIAPLEDREAVNPGN